MWTTEQNQAITARGGTLLVSAAAGSGKTSVLVERVIGMLTDAENKCPADRLLIVTFTKAATAQMKNRISEALARRVSAEPGNAYLRRQQMLLPFARICTIDSFCNDLARENFLELGIEPDYKMLDSAEGLLLKEKAAAETVGELYAEASPEFTELVELLFRGRDDRELIETIYKLNNIAGAYPFPEDWLCSLYEPFKNNVPLIKSDWGRIICERAFETLLYCISVTESLIERAKAEEELIRAYVPTLTSDIAFYSTLIKALSEKDWDDLCEVFGGIKGSFQNLGRVSKGYNTPLKDSVMGTRKILKKRVEDFALMFCVSEAENDDDMKYCAPIVKKLVDAVLLFRKKLALLKAEANAYDFSDISAFALSLLVKKEGGRIVRTELAAELSERYNEILVDEYQDINEAQDLLFESISRNGTNLFMVGDVKQSIYRFRQAMPEVFLRRRSSMSRYDGSRFPASISLDRNFRSREGVTSAVNYIFNQIMSEQTGEIDYRNGEALIAAADYPESMSPDAEIHILDMSETAENTIRAEAAYSVDIIEKMLADGLTVTENNRVRAATFRDFCILLRYDSGRIPLFVEELARRGIPAQAEFSGGLFSAPEICFMLSLLRVIDNPAQDVPLLSVMLSPVFGFSPDELARLRIDDRSKSIYACLRSAEKSDEKIKSFLETLKRYRRLSAMLPPGELIRRLLDETGFLAVAGAMSGGQGRRSNLLLLLDIAVRFEESGHTGLPGFIRFIDSIAESGEDIGAPSKLSETADVVKVMTVHKSKGLEFPICILACCSVEFNDRDLNNNYIIHQGNGIGIIRRDAEKFAQYTTVSKTAVRIAAERSAKSEELRVLYVALTRAKERLITVSSLRKPEERLRKLSANAFGDVIAPFAVGSMNCYTDWILSAMLRHPDAHIFREAAGIESTVVLPCDGRIKAVLSKPPADDGETGAEESAALCSVSPELQKEIDERLSYRYPYEALTSVIAKQAASSIDEKGINTGYFATSIPAFMNSGGLTQAQKGTAVHAFMQHADYKRASADVLSEIKMLVAEGRLTEREGNAIDVSLIEGFFKSEIAGRILKAETVFREKRFTIARRAGDMYPGLPESVADEEVIIQGMVDCAFVENGEIVIVDYKTDRGKPDEICRKYASQLAVYREAMEKCTGKRVKEVVLYLFGCGKAVEILQNEENGGNNEGHF
jgi:ATP-dependent helicase/nuclease subunit A